MSYGTVASTTRLLDARQRGADAPWTGVSTDSRTIGAGELFVALNGPSFRGVDFVADVAKARAAAAVVERFVDVDLPQIEVADTRHALGVIAAHWRARYAGVVIGVTGSNGKTTVKQLIAALLGPDAYATRGNLNNDIGVPLTLLGLDAEYHAAVIEMGANHIGEIAYLTSLVRPDVGLVTNAGPAHLEGFGSLDGVAQGKGELFYALGDGNTAIINRDDTYFSQWCDMAEPAQIVTFGLHPDADFTVSDIVSEPDGSRFTLHGPDFSGAVSLPLAGGHNVVNACAAAASAWAAGTAPSLLLERFGSVEAAPSRLRRLATIAGGVLIDDSYNANPASVLAAAEYGASLGAEVWMALGDMGELGPGAAGMHRDLGAALAKRGVARLAVIGELMVHCAEAFGSDATVCADHDAMIRHLAATLTADVVLIVKGSRAARMETVVRALAPDAKESAHA
ncbi:MAG: UDP-N-acetylmuramoyl-tripeptide--D-alanyl-D-alanine ligase [Pseudomonadota bacterium]